MNPRKTRALLAGLAILAVSSAHADEWTHAITPYLWGSGMSGTVVVGTPLGPLESDVNLSFGDILSNLKMGAMVSYEGGRGNWLVLGDLIYMKLGGSDSRTEGPITVDASADMKQSAFEADIGYRITENIALFAGARYNKIDADIRVERTGPGVGSVRSAGTSESWTDPVVGLLGEFPLTEHWQWDLRADVGGFGVGSELTWQVQGILRWKIRKNLDVNASYRYLNADFEQDGTSGLLVYDMVNTGPGLGVTFRF